VVGEQMAGNYWSRAELSGARRSNGDLNQTHSLVWSLGIQSPKKPGAQRKWNGYGQ